MKNIFIRFSKWLKLLNQTIVSLIRIIILSDNSKKFRKIHSEKNKIVILGNGPSLKSTIIENPDFFKDKDLLCVNHFGISDFYTELKPAYYIAIAHDLFLDDVFAEYIEASNKLFNTMAEKTTWPLKFFITNEAKHHERWRKILENNKNIEIIYINVTPVEGFRKFMYRQFDKGTGMPRPHNIMVPAIFTAIHLNPDKIFIIGADHSWLQELYVDENNEIYIFNQHFYDQNKKMERINHKGGSYLKLHEILRNMSTAFESYHILNGYANYKDIEILNCTPKSLIDAFKRTDIKKSDDFN